MCQIFYLWMENAVEDHKKSIDETRRVLKTNKKKKKETIMENKFLPHTWHSIIVHY